MNLERFYPVTAKLRKSVLEQRSLAEDCVAVEEVHPAETLPSDGVVISERDRNKVTAPHWATTLEREWQRVDARDVHHAATERYIFEDVLATPYGFYTRRAGHHLSGGLRLPELLGAPIHRIEKGFYGASSVCLKYFGHWLRDALPMSLLRRPDEALYLPVPKSWPHAAAYVDLLGIDRLPHEYVHFDRLAFSPDVGQNSDQRKRVRLIHDLVQTRLPAPEERKENTGLYLARGETGVIRRLLNEDALIDALLERGFAMAHSTDPLPQILQKAAGVSQVVFIEGSQWAHGYFAAKRRALFISLCPADLFNNVVVEYMPAVEGRLATVVMDRVENGYVVDVDGVLDILDREGHTS